MKQTRLICALLLASALPISTLAASAKSSARKSAGGDTRPKSESGKESATPRKSANSGTDAPKPKAKPAPESEPDTEEEDNSATPPTHAPAATLDPTDLREFAAQPPRVQQLITAALELTKLNLTYTFGSADPEKGGMDCSGTLYYLLRAQGFKDVPRDSRGQYRWVRTGRPFYNVLEKSGDTFELDDLLPGDLLFWTGTYDVPLDLPISHVMLYLGTEKKTKKPVMFGASNGRSYASVARWGVSVFDFKMPRAGKTGSSGASVDFVGYARIPGLREAPSATASAEAAESQPVPEETKASRSTTSGKSKSSKGTTRSKKAE